MPGRPHTELVCVRPHLIYAACCSRPIIWTKLPPPPLCLLLCPPQLVRLTPRSSVGWGTCSYKLRRHAVSLQMDVNCLSSTSSGSSPLLVLTAADHACIKLRDDGVTVRGEECRQSRTDHFVVVCTLSPLTLSSHRVVICHTAGARCCVAVSLFWQIYYLLSWVVI